MRESDGERDGVTEPEKHLKILTQIDIERERERKTDTAHTQRTYFCMSFYYLHDK